MTITEKSRRLLKNDLCDRDAANDIINSLEAAANDNMTFTPVDALTAGSDLAATNVFCNPDACTLTYVGLLLQGDTAGIDATHTCVVMVKDGAGNTIVSATFNNTNVIIDNSINDLGDLSAHAVLLANERVTISITNGSTAATPDMLVVVKYDLNDEE